MAKTPTLRVKTPTASGDTSKLAVNMALLAFGGMLIYAGWKGGSITEVLSGQAPTQGGQGTQDGGTLTDTGGLPDDPRGPNGVTTAAGSPMAKQGTTQKGTAIFDGKPVAKWMIPRLKWARANGWGGRVNSGYRTPSEELQAATRYGRQHYSTWPPKSNHTGTAWPRGAVDVSNASQLNAVLKRAPKTLGPPLVWGGPVIGDEVHFSATGH